MTRNAKLSTVSDEALCDLVDLFTEMFPHNFSVRQLRLYQDCLAAGCPLPCPVDISESLSDQFERALYAELRARCTFQPASSADGAGAATRYVVHQLRSGGCYHDLFHLFEVGSETRTTFEDGREYGSVIEARGSAQGRWVFVGQRVYPAPLSCALHIPRSKAEWQVFDVAVGD